METAKCDETCKEMHDQVDKLQIVRPEVRMIMHLMVHTGGVGVNRVECQWELCPHDRTEFGAPKTTLGPSIDHIRPRTLGGSDRPDNLRLAHLSCNVKASAHLAQTGRAAWQQSDEGKAHYKKLAAAGHWGRSERSRQRREKHANQVLQVFLNHEGEFVTTKQLTEETGLEVKYAAEGRHYLYSQMIKSLDLTYEYRNNRGARVFRSTKNSAA